MKIVSLLILTNLFGTVSMALGGENAAPSSHLVFDDPFDGDIIINQVRVPKDGEALYTYYETLGWRGSAAGYAGIQTHPKGHNYIFSVWDHKSHTAPIRAAYKSPGTITEKFGGEGTGLKSWNFELGWETGVWHTLTLRSWPVGDHTFVGYWVLSEKTGHWTHLVTMDVATEGAVFRGSTDAFIEDWLETGENARTIHLRRGWKRKAEDGGWHPFGGGGYSVNAWDLTEGKRSFNYRTNWNAGSSEDVTGAFYFMTAGGKDTKPTTENPSHHKIPRTETKPEFAPLAIRNPDLEATRDSGLKLSWQIDPAGLPQFSYEVAAFADPEGKGEPLARTAAITPHTRSATLAIPKEAAQKPFTVILRCRDILDLATAETKLPVNSP